MIAHVYCAQYFASLCKLKVLSGLQYYQLLLLRTDCIESQLTYSECSLFAFSSANIFDEVNTYLQVHLRVHLQVHLQGHLQVLQKSLAVTHLVLHDYLKKLLELMCEFLSFVCSFIRRISIICCKICCKNINIQRGFVSLESSKSFSVTVTS